MHQQVAHSIEARHAARVEEYAAALAEHFAHSSDSADLEKAVNYSELAAQQAMAVYAYGEAARHLEQALEVQEVLDPDDKLRRCDLLLALGEALMVAGEPQRVAEQIAAEAFALAEDLNDRLLRSHASQLALDALVRFGAGTTQSGPERRRWAERADRFAEPGTVERVYADIGLNAIRNAMGMWSEALSLRLHGLELARDLGVSEPLFAAAWPFLNSCPPTYVGLQLQLAEEFTLASRDGVSAYTVTRVLRSGALVFQDHGQRDRAETIWQEHRALAERNPDPSIRLRALTWELDRMVLDGHLEDIIAGAAKLVSTADDLGMPATGRNFATNLIVRPLIYLGRTEQALAALPEASRAAGANESPQAVAQRALCLAHLGRLADAEKALEQLVSMYVPSDESLAPTYLLVSLLETAVLVESQKYATFLASLLANVTNMAVTDRDATCIGRHTGAAAVLLADYVNARRCYEQSLEIASNLDFRPEIVLIRLGLAELDAAEGHVEAAREHLAFCIPELEAMKMRPSLERAMRLRDSLEGN